MHSKRLLSLAAAQAAWAQTQSLTDVLALQNATLSTLISLLGQQPELVSALGGIESGTTILAPSDAAFTTLLSDPAVAARVESESGFVPALLSYHVLNGTFYASDFTSAEGPLFVPTLLTDTAYTTVSGGQRVEARTDDGSVVVVTGNDAKATVEATDFNFTTGTVHVIDSVLSIPPNLTDTLTNAELSALAGAVTQADLVQTLTDVPQLTLFAPTNEAFEAIADVAAGLSVEELTAVLGYHVVPGAVVYSTDVEDGATAETVQGGELRFSVRDGGVFVNDAQVVKANVLTKNGVVHVIDSVLLPETDRGDGTPTSSSPAPSGSSSTAAPSNTVVTGMAASTMNNGVMGTAVAFFSVLVAALLV